MKRYFLVFIAILLITPVTVAYAQDSSIEMERLIDLSKKYNVGLRPEKQEVVKNTCESTKKQLKIQQKANDLVIRKRLEVYGNIQKELSAIEIRLARQGADASELDLMIGSLQQDLDDMNRSSRIHNDVTDALINIDCQENPELFAAGIYELRVVRNELLSTAKNLKKTVVESNQTTFKPLVDRLII